METFSAQSDSWSIVYAALLALAIAAQAAVAIVAFVVRRAERPLRRTAAIVSLVQLAALVATPIALALRAEAVAARFGVGDASALAFAWSAPVLVLPCLASSVIAIVLGASLLRTTSS